MERWELFRKPVPTFYKHHRKYFPPEYVSPYQMPKKNVEKSPFQGYKVKELRFLAKNAKIPKYYKMNKKQLTKELEAINCSHIPTRPRKIQPPPRSKITQPPSPEMKRDLWKRKYVYSQGITQSNSTKIDQNRPKWTIFDQNGQLSTNSINMRPVDV